MDFTVALAQIDSTVGDHKKNLAKHAEYAKRAAEGGADLVVFPELSLSGYSIRDIHWELALRLPGEGKFGELLNLSNEVSMIVGGVEESEDFGLYNVAFLLEKGEARSVHRKLYPPTYGMFEERRYFSSGKTVRPFESTVGKLGILICEDLWHLPLPYLLAKGGADVIITIAASPTRLSGKGNEPAIAEINTEQHRSYGRLLSTYMVFCNRVGFEDGVNFWGRSEVVDPTGEIVAQAKLFEEDLVFTELHENQVRRARRLSRHFLDDDEAIVLRELRRIVESKNA